MLVLVAIVAAATATAVIGSNVGGSGRDASLSADVTGPNSTAAGANPRGRPQVLSRSFNRESADPVKKAELAAAGRKVAHLRVKHVDIKPKPVHHRAPAPRPVAHHHHHHHHYHPVVASGDPRAIASAMLGSFGWSSDQFGCLTSLWDRESGWSTYATNPSSGAYGIPQALPGSKMASAGADWQTNPATQIKWGLGYIRDRYGSPCGAWAHSQSTGWY